MAIAALPSATGRMLLEAEMARQHEDAAHSIQTNAGIAATVATSVGKSGGLLMLGMGASHYANRIVEPLYRALGIEAWATTSADFINAPGRSRDGAATALVVSQSGESGEIPHLLALLSGREAFGLTLDPTSALGRSLPCLIGAGGGEVAFAATRSLFVTLALHAAILSALSKNDEASWIPSATVPPLDEACAALSGKVAIAVSGQGVLRGVAEAATLMLMELARLPALGFELGQFRHGPLELLSPDIGVLLLRDLDTDESTFGNVARAAIDAGAATIILDCSDAPAVSGATTLRFSSGRGLSAVLGVLPALQRLVIEIAAARVERVGEPVRSTKITRSAS